jgi:Protein of unknown function, DUF547
MMKRWILLITALLLAGSAWAQFDHGYAAWDALLKKHVRWLPDGKQSRVDYDGFKADRAELKRVLDAMSAVSQAEFGRFTRAQQMAFLVNAYNAFTVELILTRWPDLKSIKDLGSLLQSPWKKEFFVLLGEKRHLDWIEHDQLRPRYKDPRVHAGVNCASIGCPALRNEAFTAARIDAQFDDGMMRFMSDRTRNRVAGGKLEVNMIFKWFREDWEQGWLGYNKLEDLFVRHAAQLSDQPAEQQKLRDRALSPNFLDYDWSLNALGR